MPPGSPNPDPISHQKNVIFHTRFKIWPLKSIPILRPCLQEFTPSSLRLEQQQKRFLKTHFEFAHFSFFSYSFGIETINTFVHPRSSLTENHTRFQTKVCNVYTRFQTKTAQKPYLLRRHTGADPGFFLGGGALVSCSSTSINHIVCFFAEYQLYYKTAGRLRGWGVRTPCTLPLDPPLAHTYMAHIGLYPWHLAKVGLRL